MSKSYVIKIKFNPQQKMNISMDCDKSVGVMDLIRVTKSLGETTQNLLEQHIDKANITSMQQCESLTLADISNN